MTTDAGMLVGLATHDVPRIGSLVWIAAPTFDAEPTREQVENIRSWRWPILFPLNDAIRRKIVKPVATVPVPTHLLPFPTMRSGNRRIGWTAFTEVAGVHRQLGPTEDRSLPIYKVVNDTRLREMVASGWRPECEW